jgi:hypothetical protein
VQKPLPAGINQERSLRSRILELQVKYDELDRRIPPLNEGDCFGLPPFDGGLIRAVLYPDAIQAWKGCPTRG